MNRNYQLEHLRQILENPEHKSGVYLLDTDLNDEDIESFIKEMEGCRYVKEILIPTSNIFEKFVVGLSHKCDDSSIEISRNQLLTADERNKSTIIYSLLIQVMRFLCSNEKSVVHVQGRIDLSPLPNEDICMLDAILARSDDTILVISKQKSIKPLNGYDNNIKRKSLKETFNYKFMENRLHKVHISYKHDDAHNSALQAILSGLEKNNIPHSIDYYDITYRKSIDEYEKEIGASDSIIMFVIPKYFRSLDCMFEMTQIFKNGNIVNRIFPVVDMGEIPRNSDGLAEIKNYWQNEKVRKSEGMKTECGGSRYSITEIQKIDDIILTLNDFWEYICRTSTGNYEDLIANDAELLMAELKKGLPEIRAHIDEKFIPSNDIKPNTAREIIQNGDKSIYIENNTGSITIM